jgi:CTP:molybdopterin cytidylyltransferase MocA
MGTCSHNSGAIPAIVTAGDGRAAKAVYGESKVFLEIGGRPLVAHVVEALQRVPEVGEVWVVGNAERLQGVFAGAAARFLAKPLHVVPQFRSLYENGWQTYRRLLPGAGPEGRDPGPDDLDREVLFLSGDLPFATPQEISAFVRQAQALGGNYALGLVTGESLAGFAALAPGGPEIRPALFNLREGRFRQSNLHLIRPARIGSRSSIEEMYEHRYQREWGHALGLSWRLMRNEQGGLAVLGYYALMHLAAIAHRRHLPALADAIRRWIPQARIERGVSGLLRADFRLVVTEAGGCAVDIDTEAEYDAARQRYPEWRAAQEERALRLYGPPTLAAPGAAAGELAG